MSKEEYLKDVGDETLRKYIHFGKQYLIECPEPEILKGRSQVRRWVESAEKELERRGLDAGA